MTPPGVAGGRFDGTITGVGTASGTRVVLGAWTDTPFGPVTDVMIERRDGHRVLVAPSAELGRFIADTYGFDEVRVEPVSLACDGALWTLAATTVRLHILFGGRTGLGRLLRVVPRPLARARWWARLLDPVAARLRPGVHLIGTAGNGREERYCALDEHRVTGARVVLDGVDQGRLSAVDPPVRFGFGSTPTRPSRVRVTSVVGAATAPRPG